MDRELRRRRVAQALVAAKGCKGCKTHAAKLLGCSRQNVDEMISRSAELHALSEAIMQESIDGWEEKLKELGMQNGNVVALLALLNAHAKDRGSARDRC